MDFEYFAAPAILLLAAALVIWCGLRHLATLSTRYTRQWPQLLDRLIVGSISGVAVAFATTATFNAVDLARFRAQHPSPGELYAVNGRTMHLNCTGSGSPTLILDSGLGSDALIWGRVQPHLAETTRVCSYDRAGYGWSDTQPGPRDADHITADLHQLLQTAGVHGPLVLMGHSIAGLYIRDYAARYPQDVAGLIFVDGSTPLQDENPALAAAGETGLAQRASILVVRAAAVAGINRLAGSCARPIQGFDPQAGRALAEDLCHPPFFTIEHELDSFHKSGEETAPLNSFGSLPVLIFSQDPARVLAQKHPPQALAAMEIAWNQMQENLKKLSTRSCRIIAKGSSHAIQIDRPDLLEREVPRFIDQVRGSAPEPDCYGSTLTE